MKVIDIGANLTHESFQHDYDTVLAEARSAGLGHIILTGTDLEHSQAAINLAALNRSLLSATAGLHPHLASQWNDDTASRFESLCQEDGVVAVGETGLDYNRNFSPREAQLLAFEAQLRIAVDLQKPLFLHQRDAHDDFHRLLAHFRNQICGGVVHCFTDNERALRDYIDLDMYIGITGWICDERRGKELQDLVSLIPDDRLLVETDAPYLLPRSLQPKPKSRRNEPKYITEVISTVANCRQQSEEQVRRSTTDNAMRLFNLAVEPLEY